MVVFVLQSVGGRGKRDGGCSRRGKETKIFQTIDGFFFSFDFDEENTKAFLHVVVSLGAFGSNGKDVVSRKGLNTWDAGRIVRLTLFL